MAKKDAMQKIVDEYNKLTGKNVKSFKDLKQAKAKLKAAQVLAKNTVPSVKEAKPKKAPKEKKAPKKAPKPRAEGANPAQWVRNRVTVTKGKKTTEYRSVKQAFEELGLPLGKHIRFRMQLKSAGKLEFEGGYQFAVVR